MKHTIPKIYLKQILPLAILFVLALFIWLVGPWLNIKNSYPLLQPERRFFLISIFFLAWLIKFLFFDEDLPAVSKDKKTQGLEGRFDGALQFLKKTFISKHGRNISLSQLPWYLFIGPSGAGKTTLLVNSEINFILARQFNQEKHVALSQHCDWWATRDLVLLDVPGAYMTKEKHAASLWRNLLELIKKNCKKQTVNGVVIALNLPEILKKYNQQYKKQIQSDLKQHIVELREKFGTNLPFYLVITKCDLLPGFSDFFSDLGSEELSQAWGITIPPIKENEKLHQVFTHRFNALIKRINKQLIWRLHQERNPNARPNIKDFPLHVERLKEAVSYFIKALMIPDLRLQGVYLTSATQPIQDETQSPITINPLATQALQLARQPSAPEKAFFIRQFILQGLFSVSDHSTHLFSGTEQWLRRAVYALSIGAILTAAIVLGHDFQKSIQQAYSLQNDLAQYQLYMQQAPQQENHLVKALPLLNALREAAIQSKHSFSRVMSFLAFYSHKSQQTVNSVYTQALQTIVLPEIKNDFEHYLQAANDKNPAQLYQVLKAYLMLGDSQTLDPNYVATTVTLLMPGTVSAETAAKVAEHVKSIFSSSWQPVELNNDLISQVRHQLTSLSLSELGFILLQNMNGNNIDSSLSLGTHLGNPPVFVSKVIANQIPNMFTAAKFQKILAEDILTAATEGLQGNWVLGLAPTPPDSSSITSLTDQLRTEYIAKYVDIWESLLANIQLFEPSNITQMDAMIAGLTNTTSPLLQLLQTVQQNTYFAPVMAASPKLQTINSLLSNAGNIEQNTLYSTFVVLKQVDSYLQSILRTTNPEKAIFEAFKKHANDPNSDPINALHEIAERSPDPLKGWLHNIAAQSLKLIFAGGTQFIDSSWRSLVISNYHNYIANRFPFDANASEEVSLSQFVDFMGQPGTFISFYQAYLKPFVNENKKWEWKTVENHKLPFSESALQKIQLAMQVQRAFFPNGDKKLYIPFSLEPVSLDRTMKNFTLNINGQQITYQNDRTPRIASWPGNNVVHATAINFIAPNDKLISNVINGDWGWFRLVMQSTYQIISSKQLLLDFNLSGHSAKYMLYTQGNFNPFLMANIAKLELPEQLAQS